ncbi:MAG: alkaline phosphatase family protein [Verrucomicrobiales bacterium]|jgi:hypothetical protein|nr:alkaline phosphatase family protein [Verrucomicrobiales bacterium]
MKTGKFIAALTVTALLTGLIGGSLSAAERRVEHVFIISFDQGGGEILRGQPAPAFKKMFAEGAATWRAYTIVPSITLPSHTSMLTGVGIQEHQVDWNDYQPERGTVSVPTVFSLAKERGLTTAMFVGKEKFKHLVLPGSVDVFYVGDSALEIARNFATRITTMSKTEGPLEPHLCFIHFAEIDSTGHKFGIGSPEQNRAIADCDAALTVIRDAVERAGLAADSVFILTADHGGHNETKDGKTRGTHGNSKHTDVDIPWVAWGKGARRGVTISAPVLTYDTAATALWLLGVPVPESFWGKPVISAFE